MSFVLQQSIEGTRVTSGSSITATFSSNVGAGNLLIAVISRTSATSGVPGIGVVSDSTGNKWRQVKETMEFVASEQGIDIWCCESAAGGNKPAITATLNGYTAVAISGMNMEILEYSGVSGYELIDCATPAQTTTTSLTVTTAYATTEQHELTLSVITGNMTAATIPSGWNSRLADTTQKFWIADNLDSGTSLATQSAAWTGLTGATQGCGIIVTFKPTGTTTGPHLLQSFLYGPASSGTLYTSFTASAFPANVTTGNFLVAIVSAGSINPGALGQRISKVTDSSGGTWQQIAQGDCDNVLGTWPSIWVCPNAPGGSTSITMTCTAANSPIAGLFELANCYSSVALDSFGYVLDGSNTLGSVSTTGSVNVGDIAFMFRRSYVPYQSFLPGAGWTQIYGDTTGQLNMQMNLNTSAGVLTATTGSGGFFSNMLVAAMKPATGYGLSYAAMPFNYVNGTTVFNYANGTTAMNYVKYN